MSSRLRSLQMNLHDFSTLAPDIVVTDAVGSPDEKGADVAAKPSVPNVDTTFRAVSGDNVMPAEARPALTSRVMRGVIGLLLTACLAGLAVFWQARGETAGAMIAQWAPSFVMALLPPRQDPAIDQPSAAPAAEAIAAPAAPPPPPPPQIAVDNVNSDAAGASALLQSMTRDLTNLRQDLEQVKADIADLKARQEQMARKMAKASDPRPRGLPTPPVQPTPLPPRKPLAPPRPLQPAATSAPQREPTPSSSVQ